MIFTYKILGAHLIPCFSYVRFRNFKYMNVGLSVDIYIRVQCISGGRRLSSGKIVSQNCTLLSFPLPSGEYLLNSSPYVSCVRHPSYSSLPLPRVDDLLPLSRHLIMQLLNYSFPTGAYQQNPYKSLPSDVYPHNSPALPFFSCTCH